MFFAIFKVFSNLKTWGRWQCAPMTDFYRKVNKFFPKFAKCEMLFVCHLTILLEHCLQFLLGVKMAPSCIKPGLARQPLCHKVNLLSCVARRPLCLKVNLLSCVAWQPLCHKVNQPRCEVRRRHLIMSCDIFGTGLTTILTLCYLFGNTYKPAHSSATLESLKSTHSTTHFTKGFNRVSAKFEFRCESF